MKITYHLSWPSDWATYLLGPFPCLAPCTKKNRTKKSWVSIHLGRCKKKSTSHPTDPWILSRRVRRLRTPGINSKAAEVHRWSVAADQLVCFFEGSVPGVPHPMCFRMDGSVSIINGPWRKWRQWLCKKVLAANKWQNYIQKVAVICPLNFVNFVINFGNY